MPTQAPQKTQPESTVPDWSTLTQDDLLREAYRLGEIKLSAQLQIAIAADSRAAVLAGLFAAASSAIIAALVSAWHDNKDNHFLLYGSGVAAAVFLIAAVLCIIALRPVVFWTPGNDPSNWYGDIRKGTTIIKAIGEQADFYDLNIKANDKILIANGHWLRAGFMLGIFAPPFGVLAAYLSR